MLDNGDPRTEFLLSKVLCSLGGMCSRAGALEQAQSTLERSWRLYAQHADLTAPGQGYDPRVMLAYVYILEGSNINLVEELVREALQDNTLREDRFNMTSAGFLLAMLARVQGKYEEARHYAQQAYDYAVITGDLFQRSNLLYELAAVSLLTGGTADAKRHHQASYAIRKDFGDHRGMAETLTSLGRIALLEGDNAEARQYYEQARTIYHHRGDHVGLAAALEGMGDSALALGYYGEARRYLREALQLSSQHMVSRTLSIFVGIGELFLQTGKRARGIELLAFALHHPAGEQDTKDRAQQLLTRYHATTEAAQQTSPEVDFKAVTTALLDELLIVEDRSLTRHTPHTGETLIEPLSERELAVLTLIADGLSNREIAGKIYLSVATVKWYLTHIYSKLGVQSRTLAILRARQLNLLP